MKKQEFRSVFISDTHLGTSDCQEVSLLQFLDSFKADNLFLVGDIIDGWALKRRHHWSATQTEIIRKILKLSEKMRVTYIAGNHDEFIRPFFKYDFQIGTIQICDELVYHGADGRAYFVTHGDHFDKTMNIPRWAIQTAAYMWDYIPHSNKHSSFSKYMYKVLGTEKVIRKYIRNKGYDCAITGHTHSPKIRKDYMNCGDWVTNCTALVENQDGTWKLLYN